MGGFFGSLFGGSNPTLNNNIQNLGADAGFATGQGQTDTTAASKYYQDILSGNPTQMAESLAPQISTLQQQTQNQRNQTANFGNRSGGTAAANASADAANRGDIISAEGGLQSGAAGSLGSLGTTEQGIGLNATEAQDQASQQRMQNWQNSILGKSTSDAIQTAENAGEGAIGL
jgi:hypothetical protein